MKLGFTLLMSSEYRGANFSGSNSFLISENVSTASTGKSELICFVCLFFFSISPLGVSTFYLLSSICFSLSQSKLIADKSNNRNDKRDEEGSNEVIIRDHT